MAKLSSQEIGAAHERSVQHLLEEWHLPYNHKRKFRTDFGSDIEVDFFLPETTSGRPLVIECKNFAVEAKHPSDSKRRKTQEALWLLVQVRRYCPETKIARIILIVGETGFRADQEALLMAELGQDFYIVPLSDSSRLKQLVS